jgi:hypothetical protein
MNWSKYFFINGIKLINQRVFLLKKLIMFLKNGFKDEDMMIE